MKITVQIIHSRRMVDCEVETTDTVADIKQRLAKEDDVLDNEQILVSGGVELRDDCLLSDCCVHCEHSTLQLMILMGNAVFCIDILFVCSFQ